MRSQMCRTALNQRGEGGQDRQEIEQLEQAKTRVIDMNAQPEQGVNKMKY